MDLAGTFTVTLDGYELADDPATPETRAWVSIRFQGREYVLDDDTGKMVFPHKSHRKAAPTALPTSFDLPTDVTTGTSTDLGYVMKIFVGQGRNQSTVGVATFNARAAGSTWNITQLFTDTPIGPIEDLAGLVERAEDAAASINRGAANGVGSLGPDGKQPEGEVPSRLSAATLSATYAKRSLSTTAGPFNGAVLNPSNVSFMGVDEVTGSLYATSSGNLVMSDDGFATISGNKTLPAGVDHFQTRKILRFGANLYLLCVDPATSAGSVWKAAPQTAAGPALSWTKVLAMTAGSNATISTNLSAADGYMYAADYGDPTGGPRVWRTTDGTTWTNTLTLAATRHIHAVEPDPYNAGHVWLTAGDGQGHSVYRSTDHGATWTLLTANGKWQGVQISFDPNYVYFAGDSLVSTANVWDRDEGVFKVAFPNHHKFIPVPGPIPRAGGPTFSDLTTTNGSKTVTSPTAAFTAADRGRDLFCNQFPNRRTWIATYVNATTVTTFHAANAAVAGTGVGTIGGEMFYGNAYYGEVDPDTGAYYCVAMDSGASGSRPGFFRSPGVGQPLELIDPLQVDPPWRFTQLRILNGRVYSGPWSLDAL